MNEYSTWGKDFFIIDKSFRLYTKSCLKKYDINLSEAMVLLALFSSGGQTGENVFLQIHQKEFKKTQEEIINELHYDKGGMTRIMQSLEKKDIVVRTPNPKDNRSIVFKTTKKADELKPKILEILSSWNDLIMQGVENLDIITKSTNIMAKNAKQLLKK